MLPTGVDEIVYCGYLANYWIGFTFFESYCGKSLFGFARAMTVSLLFGFGWMVHAGLDFFLGGNYAVIAQALFGSGLLPALKFT